VLCLVKKSNFATALPFPSDYRTLINTNHCHSPDYGEPDPKTKHMKTSPLQALDAWQLCTLLTRRELTAEDLVRACLERITEREDAIHAFTQIDPDAALATAHELDAGPVRGLLHGLPIGVKDLFDSAGFATTYGSAIYDGYRPCADAAAVALCREAGAIVLGKTVSTEFAYFTPGPTRNPHNTAHTPGGSSSGSAAAVADHMLPLALGTQTAGSIIRPAAYCGVVGFKPSLGRVTSGGVKSLSQTMDIVGGFGRSVRDVGLLGAVLTGDVRLSGWNESTAPRIGYFQTPSWPQADADVQRAWEHATRVLSVQAKDCQDVVTPPNFGDLIQLQKDVMTFEMACSLSHERIHHRARLSTPLNRLLDDGMAMTGASHAANLITVAHWRLRIDALFERHDVLLTPSTTGIAPEGTATGDPLFCRSWSILGLPSVHLPFTNGQKGLPVGLQLVGRFGQDHQLLAAAHWIHERLKG
jgi:Asp-tRNA(Asn)/Glu-tRNA(Gln) amidotransferase A subunit family amidase